MSPRFGDSDRAYRLSGSGQVIGAKLQEQGAGAANGQITYSGTPTTGRA